MIWIAYFKQVGRDTMHLARLTANRYGEASDKAAKVVDLMNERLKGNESDIRYEMVKVSPLKSIEDWDDVD